MLRQFLARSLDKYQDSRGIQQEQARTPQWGRMRAHKQRLGSLAEFRLPVCRRRLSRSSLPIGHWFLDFLYLELSLACAGLHPSRQTAAPGMRFPSLSSIEYCRPSAAPRLDILPVTECLDPTVALTRRPPAPCPANSYCYSSTVEAEPPPVDTSKRLAFVPGAGPDIARSAQRVNPTPAVRV
jgi:hypothetical protein